MSLNPAEISKLIKAQIQSIDQDLEMNESGTILTVGWYRNGIWIEKCHDE